LQGFQQINIQVPHEAQFATEDAEVVVEQNGQSGTARVPLRLSTPGDFFRFPGGNLGIFQHASDYSLVTPENPARPGEAIIGYLTGMPGTDPTVPTGEPAPFDPLAIVPQFYQLFGGVDRYTLLLDGGRQTAPPLFIGLAPGLVGVYQLNFVLHRDQPSGLVSVVLLRETCSLFSYCNPAKWPTSTPVFIPVQ
jgi:uncharacterized protein (TIGR03437 family)